MSTDTPKGKMHTIVSALAGNDNVSAEVKKKRTDICDPCEFNVKNGAGGAVDKARYKLSGKPHCTLCSCFITEKAGQASEACAANPPKWQARSVQTSTADTVWLRNLNDELQGVSTRHYSLHKANYLTVTLLSDFSTVPERIPFTYELIIKEGNKAKLLLSKANCPCTVVNVIQTEGGYKVSGYIETKDLNHQDHLKTVTYTFSYLEGDKKGKTESVVIKHRFKLG